MKTYDLAWLPLEARNGAILDVEFLHSVPVTGGRGHVTPVIIGDTWPIAPVVWKFLHTSFSRFTCKGLVNLKVWTTPCSSFECLARSWEMLAAFRVAGLAVWLFHLYQNFSKRCVLKGSQSTFDSSEMSKSENQQTEKRPTFPTIAPSLSITWQHN